MVTATSGINAFDKKFYQDIASKAAGYHRESYSGVMELIPMKQLNFNVDQYKKPIFGESSGVTGGKPGLDKPQMLTAKSHNVYNLKNINAYLYYDQDDMMALGPQLVEERGEQLAQWARDGTISVFKGVYSDGYNNSIVGQGKKLINGLQDDAGSVIDLDGTDSTLAAAGDVYKALTKMVESIPFRYAEGKKVNLLMDPLFFSKANGSLFTNDSGVTEWEQFLRFYKAGDSPYQIGEIKFSNDLALVGGTDTVGTHSRIMAWIADPAIVERAYSRGFGMMGEGKNIVGGVNQAWTVKLAGCLHDSNAMLFSEQIAWA